MQSASDYLNKVELKKTTLNVNLYPTKIEENYLEIKNKTQALSTPLTALNASNDTQKHTGSCRHGSFKTVLLISHVYKTLWF